MKQTSTKHTNKNTIRSGKTITSSNLDIDDYLIDLNEPDEPVSKTSSSKHDGTITPKSKTVIAPTSTGKSLRVLNKDGQRANKAPVSYTHLDVYKRQLVGTVAGAFGLCHTHAVSGRAEQHW